jgi:hypothetical protein
MKRLWARIGMSVDVTDEEYTKIKTMMEDGRLSEAREILVDMFLNRAYLIGDSYMPCGYDCGCDNPNEYDFDLMED